MSIKEIVDIYRENAVPCDACDNNIPLKEGSNFRGLLDNITHIINPKVIWYCDSCFQKIRRGS